MSAPIFAESLFLKIINGLVKHLWISWKTFVNEKIYHMHVCAFCLGDTWLKRYFKLDFHSHSSYELWFRVSCHTSTLLRWAVTIHSPNLTWVSCVFFIIAISLAQFFITQKLVYRNELRTDLSAESKVFFHFLFLSFDN